MQTNLVIIGSEGCTFAFCNSNIAYSMEGKIGVITGVSRGIGHSLAKRLGRQGVRVVGWGLHEPSNLDIDFIRTDVRHYQEVEAAALETVDRFGRIDFLINNAGLGYFGPIEEMTLDQWHHMFDVNVHGTFYCIRSVVPYMKKQGSGHIVNVSSIAGLEGIAQAAGYCGTKFAITGITQSLFRELRDHGIKVTSVHPGSTRTDFFDNVPGLEPHPYMMDPDEVAEQIVRILDTSPNFVVNAVVFRPLRLGPSSNQ